MADSSPTGRMLVARGLYRAWLTKYFSTVSLAGLASDDEPILLRKVYVPLILTEEKVEEHEPEERLHRGGTYLPAWLSSAKSGSTFMISGEAGSGKTTLVSAVVDSLAGEIGDDLNRRFQGYVPFPILLREAPLERLNSLSDLVGWWLDQAKAEIPGLEINALREFLYGGQGIILLDGLDEVGTLERRSRVMGWLRDHPWAGRQRVSLARQLIFKDAPLNLVIVTARPSGFEGLNARDLPSAQSLFVAPFSHEQIRTYLTRWFELRPLRTDQRQSTVESLVNRLTSSEQSNRLLPLARRPAYLASLAFVHGTRGELPYTRAALYEQLVDAYIEMLDRQRGVLDSAEQRGELPVWDRQEKVEVLSAVAFQAHVGATAQQEKKQSWEHRKEDRRFLWIDEELQEAVRIAVEDGADRFRTIRPEHATDLKKYFVARTGLLVETREGQFQFGHLSFQEYLTALFVLNRAAAGSDKAAGLERILFRRLGDSGWLEVGVLALAIDANRSGGKGHEPVLARLDLTKSDHLAFLAQLLSGEEIRFTAEERRAWILVWLAFWATRPADSAALDPALRFPGNHDSLWKAWRTVSADLRDGGTGLDRLVDLVEQTLEDIEQPALPAQRSLDALVTLGGGSPAIAGSSVRRVWLHFSRAKEADLPAARLLATPLLGDFGDWQEAEYTLNDLTWRVELFRKAGPGQIQPTRIQNSLDSWSIGIQSLLRNIAERAPLLWWLQDEFFGLRASSVESGSALLIPWRRVLRMQLLRAEQSWWTSQLFDRSSSQAALDLAPARDIDRDRARNLDRDRAMRQARARIRDLDRARLHVRDLAWRLDQELARTMKRVHDRDLSRDLARGLDGGWDLERAQSEVLNMDLASERNLEFILSALKRRKRTFARRGPSRNQATFLCRAAIQGVSLSWLFNEAPLMRRPELTSSLHIFRNHKAVTASLEGTPFAEQAIQEWDDVLASPFSPIPLLEDALSREWDELPTSPEGIAQLFEEALSRLEKSL